jgi:sec-independent protein translocase protein TatB
VFNLSGSEIVVILLLALVVLGPEKLPEAMRRAGKTFAELKKLSSGFQDEVRKGFEEPAREVKKTASAVKSAARFPVITGKTAATGKTNDKPTYNPATDPPPEVPEGSSVAEPLEDASPDAAEATVQDFPAEPVAVADAIEPIDTVADVADVAGATDATAVVPATDTEPAPTAEADRTA